MAKRNFLFWGGEDAGKSTMAASLLPRPATGDKPAISTRWPRVDWYNLDKPGVGSVAWAFAPGSGARLIEIGATNFDRLAASLEESARRAAAGAIDAIVCEGLSVFYSDDVGLAGLANPDAIAAGGNAARGLYKAPKMRLGAIMAGLRHAQIGAKNPNFLTILTAHAKEVGEDRRPFPDVSRNAWHQFVRLSEVVLYLDRQPKRPPKITYSLKEDDLVLARINSPQALAYFDAIHQRRDEDAIARMRTVPGLVGLLEHAERAQQKPPEAAQTPPTTSET